MEIYLGKGNSTQLRTAMSTPNQQNASSASRKIAVVGCGNVGATFAYTLLLSGLADEIVLVDANRIKAEGEAMDLNHAVPFARSVRVSAGDYDQCAGAAVTVIAAGVAQRPNETRIELLARNAAVFRQIVPEITRRNPGGILVIATNPVDVLSYATYKLSGFPAARVIGSGTILDTARFRYLLSQRLEVDARSVHAHIIGEHGDSEVAVWSLANVAGIRLADYPAPRGNTDGSALEDTFVQTRDAAYHIIERKGATYYAVAAGLLRLVESILRDQRTVLSVSTLITDYYDVDDVYLSLPAVIDRGGVNRVLELELSPSEQEAFRRSAAAVKDAIRQIPL